MYQMLIIFHFLVAVGIIALVMMQHGRGADAGAAFGSGASGTVFGARGASSFLTRTTAVFATLFFGTSLVLAIMGGPKATLSADLMDVPVVDQAEGDLPPVLDEINKGDVSDMPLLEQGAANDVPDAPVEDIPEVETPAADKAVQVPVP